MEQKEVSKRLNPLWTLSYLRSIYKRIDWSPNLFSFSKINRPWVTSSDQNKGFTLIELIIVTAMIAMLAIATLATLNPFGQFNKARDGKMKSDLGQIQKALEVYYQDKGRYPPIASNCQYEISGVNGDGNDCIEWGKSWQPYMNIIPQDTIYNHAYIYYANSSGQAYYLYATLNNTKDPQACNGGVACTSLPGNGITANACGGPCNYAVTSPNVNP